MWHEWNMNTDDIMMVWFTYMWHEWNMNTDDIMMMWFTSYVNPSDVTSGMHDACALSNMGMSEYQSGLACMQADLNLGKISTSHFWVLNTQNATRTCQTWFPLLISMRTSWIAMRIWHDVNENPLFVPTCFGTKERRESSKNFILHSFSDHNF